MGLFIRKAWEGEVEQWEIANTTTGLMRRLTREGMRR
jgi:hypothetical protein